SLAFALRPPADGASAVAPRRDLMLDAPDELGPAFGWVTAPDEPDVPAELRGELIAATLVCWAGDLARGERVLAPRRAEGVAADLVGPVPYADFQCAIDDPP